MVSCRNAADQVEIASFWLSATVTVLGTLAALGLLLVATERVRARTRRFALGAGSLLIGLGAVEVAAWAMLRIELFSADAAQRRAYIWLSNDRFAERDDARSAADGMTGTGLISTFAPYPFLNFALNQNAAYMGETQFNSDYLIRRTEP